MSRPSHRHGTFAPAFQSIVAACVLLACPPGGRDDGTSTTAAPDGPASNADDVHPSGSASLSGNISRRPETDARSACLLDSLDGRFVSGILAARCPETGLALREGLTLAILEESESAGFPPSLVLGLIHVESRFRLNAYSSAGAQGLVQLQVPTARHQAAQDFLELSDEEISADPELQVRLGIRYLADLKRRFGSVDLALMAYNAGPTRIQRLLSGKHASLDAYRDYPRSVHRAEARFDRKRQAFAQEFPELRGRCSQDSDSAAKNE